MLLFVHILRYYVTFLNNIVTYGIEIGLCLTVFIFISLQDSVFMIPQKKRFPCKIQTFNQMDVIEDLKNTFSDKQKDLFKATVFGHFLSMPNICFQAQLVHHVLLREVYSDKEDREFWFNIKGSVVRYSVEEFCLITGLKCDGDDDTSTFLMKNGGLKDITFPGSSGKVTKKQVRDAFIQKKVDGDENLVKLGIVHLLSNFLFGTIIDTKVNTFFWAIVDCDQQSVDNFPFGKMLWESSRSSMRKALIDKGKIYDDRLDSKTGKVEPFSYRLIGFPIAFLIWIYETIPSLSNNFCEKTGNFFPKINCWASEKGFSFNSFDQKVFSKEQVT